MDDTTALWGFLSFIGVTLVGIVSWFAREERNTIKDTLKHHGERLDRFERCVITREEFEKWSSKLIDERREQHMEGRLLMERIAAKIDQNEERAAKTRHDTKDEVHALSMKLALLTKEKP